MLEYINNLLKQAYSQPMIAIDYDLVRKAGVLLADITPQLRESNRLDLHPWYDVKRHER